MTNETYFADAYLKASTALMEAIANPTRGNFDIAKLWSVRARRVAQHNEDVGAEGSERDLACRLYEAIVMASKYHYCSLIY